MEIELQHVVSGLKRRGWVILLTMLLTGALAYVLTSGQSATYSATTTLLVNPQQVTGSSDSSALAGSRSQAETYVRLVESGPVLNRVNAEFNLTYTQNELAAKIESNVVMNTQLIEITVKDASPEEAARIANSVASQFEAQIEDLTVGRLQNNLTQAQTEITSLQQRQVAIDQELTALDTDANKGNIEIQQQIGTLKDERTRGQETIADLQSTVRSINRRSNSCAIKR